MRPPRIGGLGLVLALLAFAAPARSEWRPIGPASNSEYCTDGAGRLWMLWHPDEIAVWPLADCGWPEPEARWVTHRLPAGVRGVNLAVVADTVYVAGRYEQQGRHTVFRGSPGPDGALRWTELPVAAIGILFGLAVDASGTVWLGGERGEIFRWTGETWAKEVAPLPIHCRSIHVSEGGQLWAWGITRGHAAVFQRDHGSWRVARTFPTTTAIRPCRFDDDGFVVQVGDELVRFRLHEDAPVWRRSLPPGSTVAMETADTGWALREGAAARLLPGGGLEPAQPPPFPPTAFPRVIRGHLVVCSPTTCWVYFPKPGSAVATTGAMGMIPRLHSATPQNGYPTHGIALVEVGDATYAYLTHYTQPDGAVLIRGAPFAAEATARLGLDRIAEGQPPDPIYRTTALAADLNADGREDLLVSSMYDGCRLLRNLNDRRFVGWTKESGIGGGAAAAIVQDTELLDADADGDLDLFVAVLHEEDRLYVNDGAAGFRLVPDTGMQSGPGSVSATAADLDRDGDTDLLVPTWGHGLRLHENLGPRGGAPRFRTHVLLVDTSHPDVPAGLSRRSLMAAATGDLDGDALPEVIVSARAGAPILLRNGGGLRLTEAPGAFPGAARDPTTGAIELLDADNDGDLDVFTGGHGGTRPYENRGGVFSWTPPVDWDARAKLGAPRIMGLVAVDVDEDGDPDLLEAGDPGSLLVHENTGPTDGVASIGLLGPSANRSAIGATVDIFAVEQPGAPVASMQVPGGTGAGSHRTRRVFVTGLEPGRAYDIVATLPGGERGTARVVVPARATVEFRPGGIDGHVARARSVVAARILDHWNVRWLLLLLGLLAIVLATQAGRTAARQRPIRAPWLPASLAVALAVGVRAAIGDPGGSAVFASALAGLGGGLLSLALLPLVRESANVELLAELSVALQSFNHNQTPRKMLDRFRFVAANLPAAATPENAHLISVSLENLRDSILPEFRAIVAKARAAGIDAGAGEVLLAAMTRRAGAAGTPADAMPALAAHADTFVQWIRSLRKEVDAAVTSSLDDLVRHFAESRRRVHAVSFRLDVVPARVRLPEMEAMRVLDVLLENSLRAVERGLEVSLRIENDPAGRARLTFADNGPGIPAADREKVFDRTFTRFADGSGFGLYAAQRTVRRFGGDIRVDAGAASGARFVLELEAV